MMEAIIPPEDALWVKSIGKMTRQTALTFRTGVSMAQVFPSGALIAKP